MKLVFGLGNIGKEYDNTRHNVGFQLIDYLREQYNVLSISKKMNGENFKIKINDEEIILIKPQKYMNLSGDAVRNYVKFYKVSLDDILVIHDDIDMELGKIRFVYDSTNGGHNGIRSIESCLGSRSYLRLKIGVSKPTLVNVADYVTGKFNKEEQVIIKKINEYLKNIIEDFVVLGKQELMCKYNNRRGYDL